MHQTFIKRFNTISFSIVTALAILLPLFFLPTTVSGLGAVKGFILYFGVFIATSFWLLAQFVQGSLTFPKHKIFAVLGLWVILALASALASANIHVSLWGRGFALDSFATVLTLALLTFLVATFAREQKRLVKLFLATFAGSVITVFLQVILYVSQNTPFVAKYFSHVSTQGTLVGSWIDFAYFVMFTFILALLMNEVLQPRGFFRVLSLVAMVLSLAVLVFLNFKIAWIVAIIASLLVFVYKSSVERSVARFFPQTTNVESAVPSTAQQRFPLMSFGALLIGLFFFLSSGSIGASIARYAGVNFNDIRPSASATVHVARASLLQDPILGAGAGRYGAVWDLYHPLGTNETQFWNTTFQGGFSIIGSTLTTNGPLVTLALLAILILSLIHGFKLFNYQFPDIFSRFIAVAAFIMLIAFVCLFALASPGIVLVAFGFIFLGLLLGVSMLVGRTPVMTVEYLRDPRLSFFAILILVLATMTGFTAAYFTGNRFASMVNFQRAVAAPDIASARTSLDRALSLSENDVYWRTRAALFVQQFTTGASAESPNKAELQTFFTQAEQSARAAIAWDSTDANNWLVLSQVYQLALSGDNAEVYTNATGAATEAQKRSPLNPLYVLNQATLLIAKEDYEGALILVDTALSLKSNYLDAFILRGQIRERQGVTGALTQEIIRYTTVMPMDDQGYVLLGQAYTASKQYQQALDAFMRAKELNPANPNTSLNIISTLITMGQKSAAIDALNAFKKDFPTVTGVDEKIKELQSAPTVTPTTEEKES